MVDLLSTTLAVRAGRFGGVMGRRICVTLLASQHQDEDPSFVAALVVG